MSAKICILACEGDAIKDAILELTSKLHGTKDVMLLATAPSAVNCHLERMLQALYTADDENAQKEWLWILDSYVLLMQELGLKPNEDVRVPLMPEYNPIWSYEQNYDQIISIGVIWLSQILAVYLLKREVSTECWNLTKFIRTDSAYTKAQIDLAYTAQVIYASWNRVERKSLVVAPAGVSGTIDGHITTLGNNGVAMTAKLMAAILDTNEIEKI